MVFSGRIGPTGGLPGAPLLQFACESSRSDVKLERQHAPAFRELLHRVHSKTSPQSSYAPSDTCSQHHTLAAAQTRTFARSCARQSRGVPTRRRTFIVVTLLYRAARCRIAYIYCNDHIEESCSFSGPAATPQVNKHAQSKRGCNRHCSVDTTTGAL